MISAGLLDRLRAAKADPIGISPNEGHGDLERDVAGVEISDVDEIIATLEPRVYLVAQSTPPTIICPPWCTTTQEHHQSSLEQLDGRAGHMSSNHGVDSDDPAASVSLHLQHTTLADGTPDNDPVLGGPPIVALNDTELSLEAAEVIALAILTLVREARR